MVGALGDFAGGFFEEFVDEGLVGFGLLGGHAAELAEIRTWEDLNVERRNVREKRGPSTASRQKTPTLRSG